MATRQPIHYINIDISMISISNNIMVRCRKETSIKYIKRKSPSFSANKCKYKRKKGNNGVMYKSVPNKKGVFRWIKIKKRRLHSKHLNRISTSN